MLGSVCTVPGFAFMGPPAAARLVTEDFSGVAGTVRQAGIIGTDFLSERVFTLGYGARQNFASPAPAFCSDAALEAAGMSALSTAGFFAQDLSLLKPATAVDSTASPGSSVPNVPTVPVRIAGATAVAQLDTGFDDDVTMLSVNVNVAFLQAIQAASPSALVRDATLDEALTTCVVGVSEPVQGYRLAPGGSLDFVDGGAHAVQSFPGAVVFVKQTPAAAHSCGGIGTWTVPAAQVAASYYVAMGTLVFDPFTSRVWLPMR
jgi:hypothetical protein